MGRFHNLKSPADRIPGALKEHLLAIQLFYDSILQG